MTREHPAALRLHPDDNVAIAVERLAEGAEVEGVAVRARIPRGHKVALAPIAEGEPVRKYGQVIGFASAAIAPGEHVHVQNLAYREFDRDLRIAEDAAPEQLVPEPERRSFHGFRRSNGRIGTRNYIGIMTSVNCSASVAKFIAEEVERSGILADYPNVDGVAAFVHGTGCGMAASGEAFEQFERLQWGYATHPNLGAALMVGLGCEVFQIPRMKQRHGLEESDGFRSLTIQEQGGTRRAVEAGVAAVREMLPIADAARREPCPASALSLALQCGGSDGYSGITANPALGIAADLLVAQGGTAILAETPEIYGAEHLLTRRAESREVGEKLLAIIDWWRDYTAKNGMVMDANPSPGNKAGGLTTILEKSLGAAAKGGSTTLRGAYRYAEPVDRRGFVFMDSPGYDPASVTGQVASGANIVAFTTGRGSAFGCKPAPSIKLATNPEVYVRMTEDMDLNCGDVLEGVPLAEKGAEIFEKLLAVASGERTASEKLGYGDNEFTPWQIGAVM
jgi:altronate hydrolase